MSTDADLPQTKDTDPSSPILEPLSSEDLELYQEPISVEYASFLSFILRELRSKGLTNGVENRNSLFSSQDVDMSPKISKDKMSLTPLL
jgi:hypothetical protein